MLARAFLLFLALGLCLDLGFAASAVPALAAESPALRSPRVTAALVTDTDAVAPGQAFRAGLRLRLAPGWHVYWRNPGEAGVATEVTPTLPGGAASGPVQWPAPERLTEAGITVYGYTGDVVLPFTVTPGAPSGTAFRLSAAASWLVCQSICVPEEGTFVLDLPWGAPAPSAEASLLADAAARVPAAAPFDASVSPSGVLTLSGAGLAADDVRGAAFFPDGPDTVVDGADQAFSAGNGQVRLRLTPGPGFHPGTLTGVVVLRDVAGATRAVAVAPRPGPEPAPCGCRGIGVDAGPGVRGRAAAEPDAVRVPHPGDEGGRAGAAGRGRAARSPAGSAGLYRRRSGDVLRPGRRPGADGRRMGHPVPVTRLRGHGGVAAVRGRAQHVGRVDDGRTGRRVALGGARGAAGAFLTGALAVGVAAPCTAPFMGTAVAAALTLPAAAALGVFAAMGAGLAAPYLLLAAVPGVARVLPRPGRWMQVLKGALAFPMYAAAAWLVWVVGTEAGPSGVLLAVSGLVLVGFAAWVWTVAATSARGGRRTGRALAAVAVLLAAGLLPRFGAEAEPGLVRAEPFTTERLAALRAEGRPVFVDMTAAWCLPCLFNERVALAPAAVQQAFADRHVAVLRGDWTRKDPAITAFLRSQDRDGVPLYVFYPAGGGPVVLPQVLTAGIVLDRIGRAAGDT